MDRLKFFQIIIYLIALAIVSRLFYWQFLSSLLKTNRDASPETEIPARHGEVFASDGFPLVTNQEAFLVFGKPQTPNAEPSNVAKSLAPYLISERWATMSAQLPPDLDKEKEDEVKAKEDQLKNKLSDKKLFWVLLARKVTKQVKEAIEKANIPGVGFERDDKRFYPEGSMAAQLLGFVASDKLGKDTGYFGLEGFYNRKIRGKPGQAGQDLDPLGIPILIGKYNIQDPQKGSDLHLNIDRTIQFIVEKNLAQDVEKYGAKNGSVIVEDPKTGRILAMATYPTFNPSFFSQYDQSLYQNLAVADTYEPGSTFKVLVMAAALDKGVVTPNTVCDVCSGPRKIGGYQVETWNQKYFPNSTMTDVIEHSDNVGMTFVGDKLGLDNLYSYIQKFGFGQKTGIDLEEEAQGTLRDKKDWHAIDISTATFGQGIAVTPIQIVQAVSAIANGGKLISPTIVKNISDRKQEVTVKPQKERQVISQSSATQMTEMMVSAVDKGEAQFFKPKGYRIAGKTGTAQIPVAGHYDPTKTIASFVGFAPADNPKFVMLVKFTEPSSSIFGAETAAPTFFNIARELFTYFGVPPEK